MKTIYKSFDGKEFEGMDECLEYEKKRALQIKGYVNAIKEFCEMFKYCDGNCPFYDEKEGICQLNENPSNW